MKKTIKDEEDLQELLERRLATESECAIKENRQGTLTKQRALEYAEEVKHLTRAYKSSLIYTIKLKGKENEKDNIS